jgi:hypothetical protein
MVKIHCNRCQGETNHTVLAQAMQDWEYLDARDDLTWDGIPAYMRRQYSIVECRGCEEVSFLLESDSQFTFANQTDKPPFEADREVTATYPPRLFRHLPTWFGKIPDVEVQNLLQEVYSALQNDSRRLAVMGVRTALDMLITKAVGDLGAFKKKQQAYVELTRVGRRTEDAIQRVFEFGSAAVHRGFHPSNSQIIDAVDALEHILHEHYILPQRTHRMEEDTPPKPPLRKP